MRLSGGGGCRQGSTGDRGEKNNPGRGRGRKDRQGTGPFSSSNPGRSRGLPCPRSALAKDPVGSADQNVTLQLLM